MNILLIIRTVIRLVRLNYQRLKVIIIIINKINFKNQQNLPLSNKHCDIPTNIKRNFNIFKSTIQIGRINSIRKRFFLNQSSPRRNYRLHYYELLKVFLYYYYYYYLKFPFLIISICLQDMTSKWILFKILLSDISRSYILLYFPFQ